ncbi:MAG TPA: N-acetylglucosamine-6-phosphate deacetylase [Dehalococcoidia bacterium]|nr:N-acetylglucosamine-6-phosphate deacetylase [Dehalococcoidia bacterium]
MTARLLRNAEVLTPERRLTRAAVLIDGGRIVAVGADVEAPAAEPVDLHGLTLVPGFVDVHVHGGGGHSLIGSHPERVLGYARWAPRHGVTAFLAGTIGATAEAIEGSLRRGADLAGQIGAGAQLLGFHLEGPYLSPRRRGAFASSWLLPPDVRQISRFAQAADGHLSLLTIAPELPGAREVIEEAVRSDVRPSLGHTDASYEEMLRGFELGARHVTHCFNAMRPFMHRNPGPVAAALTAPGVRCELIADGVHVAAGAMRLLLAARGAANIVLVTDGIEAAGAASGQFELAGQPLAVRDGRALAADGTLAGSIATMDVCLRNAVRLGGADLREAAAMASLNPAQAIGVADDRGRVAPGYRADLVALTPELRVARTWIGGTLVYDGH